MEKYLYFRKSSTLTDDHDQETGSIMYPVSALQGIFSGDSDVTGTVTDDDDRISLFFKPAAVGTSAVGAAASAVDNNPDIILLDLTTANTQKAVYQALVQAINGHPNSDGFIDVFDAVNGTGIAGVSGIHVVTTVIND